METTEFLWALDFGEAGARAIAEHLTQLQSLWLDNNQVGQATIGVLGPRQLNLTRLSIGENKDNQALRDCDIVVSLFKTQVGKCTEEEFDVAWETFTATGKPRIFTFFRSFQLSDRELETKADDLDSLKRFKQKLSDLGIRSLIRNGSR